MNEYVLAMTNHNGNPSYWTGKYTPHGKPSVSNIEQARKFKTAAQAYYAGTINKKLGLFRAVGLYSDYTDGFISHWWLPDKDDEDGYE